MTSARTLRRAAAKPFEELIVGGKGLEQIEEDVRELLGRRERSPCACRTRSAASRHSRARRLRHACAEHVGTFIGMSSPDEER